MKTLGFIAVIVTGALLIYAESDFPDWGDPWSPASTSPVSEHYITQAYTETSVPNIVTAVLADYRSYDTLFETVVIFTAGIAIIAILQVVRLPGASRDEISLPESKADTDNVILITTGRLLIPCIQLFALYVVAHGHHSPGGGFQGGVIFGASLILLALSRDLGASLDRLPERRALVLAAGGIVIFAGIGVACLLLGRNFLDYGVLHRILPVTEIEARSLSMLGVEIGVAFTVTTIMYAIYANLSSHGRMKQGL